MATIEKRNGAWRARVRRAGHDTQTQTFDTKAKAERWARDLESRIDKGEVPPKPTPEDEVTLKELLDRYCKSITPEKKGAKQETSRIARLMRQPLAQMKFTKLTKADFARYRDQRVTEGKAPSTIRNELNLIRHLYRIAIAEWGYDTLTNPLDNLRMPKMNPGRSRRLSEDEEKRLFAEAEKTPALLAAIIVAIDTGMRRSEIVGMRWSLINLGDRILLLKDTKNGESREVPLTKRVKEALMHLPKMPNDRVWPWGNPDTLSHSFEDACVAAGINNLRFHDLRHEAASRLFEKNLGIMHVAAITGHKTLHMLKRYTHIRAKDLVGMID